MGLQICQFCNWLLCDAGNSMFAAVDSLLFGLRLRWPCDSGIQQTILENDKHANIRKYLKVHAELNLKLMLADELVEAADF